MVRIAILCCLATGTVAATASAAQSPAAFSAAVHRAAKSQRSVHYVSLSRVGTTTVSMVADVARDHGIQRITFRQGAKTGHATVIVAAQVCYLRAEAFAMQRYLGFSAAAAAGYANRWIRIVPTDHAYATVAAAVTLGSAIDELGPIGTLRLVKGGVQGTVVRNGARLVDTVFARAGASPLPLKEVATQPGATAENVFGPWNRAVRVTVPAGAVPIATVLKGGPTA